MFMFIKAGGSIIVSSWSITGQAGRGIQFEARVSQSGVAGNGIGN